jgi:hypothetical protein
MPDLAPHQLAILKRFSSDLEYFSRHCLKITDKTGATIPLIFNRAQRTIHARIEKQRAEIGRVRAVILKGRQLGSSTYIQGRLYWRTMFQSNLSAYVLAHQVESTIKIFSMAQRFRRNLPSDLQIPLEKDTERAMAMSNNSSYAVGTAGSAQIGRGMTVNLLHSSETAFYESADEISVGLLQAVPDAAGSEIIFESTANGPGNFFYDLCMGAIAGKNGFQMIFIPWYYDDEYQDPVPLKETDLTERERSYYETCKDDGLTLRHLAWRRRKIASLGDKEWRVQQEYPTTVEEAFITASERFFSLPKVYSAQKRKPFGDPSAPLVVGIDQGRTGDDTVICRRLGRTILPFETIPADDGTERDMRLAGRIAQIIEREKPDMVVIDTTSEHGALDRLHEMNYPKRLVKGVHFGEKSDDPTRFRNKRVEMYFNFKEWFEDDKVSIPENQKFMSEIGAIPQEKFTSNNVAYLVSKDDIRADLGWSPDILDSAILTFAFPVRRKVNPDGTNKATAPVIKHEYKSGLRSFKKK